MLLKDIVTLDDFEKDMALEKIDVSIMAMNSFCPHNSSSRQVMFMKHASQSVVNDKSEDKIIQSGLERQLKDSTFSIDVKNDCEVLSQIYRNKNEGVLIVRNLDDGKLDCIDLYSSHTMNQRYGFELDETEEVYKYLTKGTALKKSRASKDDTYRYGVNTNVGFVSSQSTAEDGFILSKSYGEKLLYHTYHKIIVNVGYDGVLVNCFGNINEYKPLPTVGDYIHENGTVCALRTIKDDYIAANCSNKDMLRINYGSDTVFKSKYGKVTDVKVYSNLKNKKSVMCHTYDYLEKFSNETLNYYKKILSVVDSNKKLTMTGRLHRLYVKAYSLVTAKDSKLNLTFKHNPLEGYRVEITVMHENKLVTGCKFSNSGGGKGVAVTIVDDELMPTDEFGNRAHMLVDMFSIVNRMNPGILYEQYISGVSRKTKYLMSKETDYIKAFKLCVDMLSAFENKQYYYYKEILDKRDLDVMKEIVDDIRDNELFILIELGDKNNALVVEELRETIFAPKAVKSIIKTKDGFRETSDKIFIAPLYVLLLARTPDMFNATASAVTNHHGYPVSIRSDIKKNSLYKDTPVKFLSETDVRILFSCLEPKDALEFKKRSGSQDRHREVYREILNASKPSNIERLVDSNPDSEEDSVRYLKSILSTMGVIIEESE